MKVGLQVLHYILTNSYGVFVMCACMSEKGEGGGVGTW